MKYLLLLILLTVLPISTLADSDGYGCYGKGVIAFDEAFEDRKGLYIVLFGREIGISKKFRVELPRSHGSYSQGIKCESDKVSILLRGVPPELNTREVSKYLMHLTIISLIDRNNPSVISDEPNHYQVWKNYRSQKPEPINASTPIASLPEPNLRLKDTGGSVCGNREVKLDSNDPDNTYALLFDNSKTESNVKGGGGDIYHRCETKLVMRNAEGKTIQSLLIANTESLETIH